MPARKHEQGQGLVEYALLFIFVFIVVMGVLIFLGPAIGNMYSTVMNSI